MLDKKLVNSDDDTDSCTESEGNSQSDSDSSYNTILVVT